MSAQDLISALGLLGPLYADPQVREILVDGPERVRVERTDASGTRIEDTPLRFETPAALRAVIDAVLALGGVSLGPLDQVGEASLARNAAHVVVALPPTAIDGPYLALRKLTVTHMTWDDLLGYGSVTPAARDYLLAALERGANLLVTGNANAGKTTFANILASSIAPEQRLVVVEAVQMFQLRHPRAIFLEAGGPGRVAFADLIALSARMRPDWLIVGELSGPEALTALNLLSQGHTAIAALHAEGPLDALLRLERMCKQANAGLSLGDIRAVIASAVQIITHQRYFPGGARRLTDIVELSGVENGEDVLRPRMSYNPETERIEPV